MTNSELARRQPSGLRPFGTLPPSQTGMAADRALELAGVDATEFALLASTTFKEARTLEELVTVIAAARRRGLDGLSKQVYYERFGGASRDPSLHTGIDGLRAIAAATGRYGGSGEPRFSDAWDMPLNEAEKPRTKRVPAKCVVTVWAIVQGRSCAFEGVAWMEESYPGAGPRGRMWQQRPHGMLSIAAERQALRKAFPNETSGLADAETDDVGEPESLPPPPAPTRTVAENAALYDRIVGNDDEQPAPPPAKRERTLDELVDYYGKRVQKAIDDGLLDEDEIDAWILPADATRKDVMRKGAQLQEDVINARTVSTERSEPPAELTTSPAD
jgi:phage recombination protein Bet